MHYAWSSPSLPQLLDEHSPIQVSNEEGYWLAVMTLIGSICGSVLGMIFLDYIGRKRAILISSVPFFGAWITIYCAKSFSTIIVARTIAGISDGLVFCALPAYLAEISNPQIRGFLGSGVSVTWTIGILLINVIGSYVNIATTALVSSILPLMCLLSFAWMPETPYYQLMKNNVQGARQSLRVFKGVDDVEIELERLTQAVKEQQTNKGDMFDLLTHASNRRALLIGCGLRTVQQFTGASVLTFYAQLVFKESGSSISPSMASIIYFSVQVVLASCASLIVDQTGRKPLLVISIIGAGAALLTESVYFFLQNTTSIDTSQFSAIPLVALFIYVIVFGIGLQTIPLLMLGELFPTNVKAFALGLIDIYFSIITCGISKLFQYTKDEYGLHIPFIIFTLNCVLGLYFIVQFVPETKNKTLEEIQSQLKGFAAHNEYIGCDNLSKQQHDSATIH